MKRYSFRIIIAGIKEDILGICNFLGKDTEYFQNLRQFVSTFDQKYQVFAAWLKARNFEPDSYVEAIQKYVDAKKITKFSVSAKAVKINDEVFSDAEKLIEHLLVQFPVIQLGESSNGSSQSAILSNSVNEQIPVIGNKDNSIKIFEINNAKDAIKTVGDDTSWCIGATGPNNMWQSYRDSSGSTFFIIEDNNPPTPDQRKVAVDFTENGVLLTDIPNKTGKTLSNGWTWDEYKQYLSEKGVNLEATRQNPETGEEELILKNKPRTDEERTQSQVFSTVALNNVDRSLTIPDLLLWQSGRSRIMVEDNSFRFDPNTGERLREDKYQTIENPDAKFYLSRYMGLGRKLTPEVLSYLLEKVGGEDVITKYLNTGYKIPHEEYEVIKSNKKLLLTYLRKQVISCVEMPGDTLDDECFKDLMFLNRRDLLKYYVSNVSVLGNQLLMLYQDPELLKLQIKLKIDSGYPLDERIQNFLVLNQDRESIKRMMEYMSLIRCSIPMKEFVEKDPELSSLIPKSYFDAKEFLKIELDDPNENEITASISKIVRIAKKLDHKNYYKLADKFTNILRRYDVQP